MIADYVYNIARLFTSIPTIIASIGLIIATSSFMSGLQLVRGASRIEKLIHRYNGIATLSLYGVLFVMSLVSNGFRLMPFLAWLSGWFFIFIKILIVRKRGRALKYVSWVGTILILMWLYLIYIHLPI
jgi:hypothetical protein